MTGGSTSWQDMINYEHCFVFLNKSSSGAEAESESDEEQKHHCLTDAMANNAATNSHNKQAISSLIRPPALTVKVQMPCQTSKPWFDQQS